MAVALLELSFAPLLYSSSFLLFYLALCSHLYHTTRCWETRC